MFPEPLFAYSSFCIIFDVFPKHKHMCQLRFVFSDLLKVKSIGVRMYLIFPIFILGNVFSLEWLFCHLIEVNSTLVVGSLSCLLDRCSPWMAVLYFYVTPDTNYRLRRTRVIPKLCAVHSARERETCNRYII